MRITICRPEDGPAQVKVIDPTDGATAQSLDLNAGEEVTIVATTANSPADIEVGEVCQIGEGTSAPAEGETPESSDPDPAAGQGGETAPGAEDPANPTAGEPGQGETPEPEDPAAA